MRAQHRRPQHRDNHKDYPRRCRRDLPAGEREEQAATRRQKEKKRNASTAVALKRATRRRRPRAYAVAADDVDKKDKKTRQGKLQQAPRRVDRAGLAILETEAASRAPSHPRPNCLQWPRPQKKRLQSAKSNDGQEHLARRACEEGGRRRNGDRRATRSYFTSRRRRCLRRPS